EFLSRSRITRPHSPLRFQIRKTETAYWEIARRNCSNARDRSGRDDHGFDPRRSITNRHDLFRYVRSEHQKGGRQAMGFIWVGRSFASAGGCIPEGESASARLRKLRPFAGPL